MAFIGHGNMSHFPSPILLSYVYISTSHNICIHIYIYIYVYIYFLSDQIRSVAQSCPTSQGTTEI